MVKHFIILIWSFCFCVSTYGQFTLDDTLRGRYSAERSWWDLQRYELTLKVLPKEKFISGVNKIQYKVLQAAQTMQIDLQPPMAIDSIVQNGLLLNYTKKGLNAYFVKLAQVQKVGETAQILVYFQGHPKVAVKAPWDGGFSWSKDAKGNDFVATSCQGLGASVWWPCKDHMADEAESMQISVTVPDSLWDVSNGQLKSMSLDKFGNRTCVWEVKNPINNYGVNVNIAHYSHFAEIYKGEKGPLRMDYYVLPENLAKAKIQFKDAPKMMKAFEYWFGPYPFYEDGYKLVEVPYLGMEHQSSVTYGNKFANGYLGRDLSGTGWGLKWDFIIIHESGHEWFANNITYKDAADMWIHEGFTNYSEALFIEYYYGKKAADEYVKGLRKTIANDVPIIGKYDLNNEGSRDMYNKGGNMIHTIRQIINDDSRFRNMLRGLNKTFYHQTVTTKQIENFISKSAKRDLSKVFDQYLRGVKVPTLVISKNKNILKYHWTNTLEGFDMPIDVTIDHKKTRLYPNNHPKQIAGKNVVVNPNYYINTEFK